MLLKQPFSLLAVLTAQHITLFSDGDFQTQRFVEICYKDNFASWNLIVRYFRTHILAFFRNISDKSTQLK